MSIDIGAETEFLVLSVQDLVLALDEFLQSLPLLDLLGSRGTVATLVRILPGAQLQPQGGAVQFQDPAEAVDEVAAIAIRQGVGLLAVDDDDGGIASTLVGIAQLVRRPLTRGG